MMRRRLSVSLAVVFALAASSQTFDVAFAAPKLPKGDKFWAVSDFSGSLYGWNPATKTYVGQPIDGPENGVLQGAVIGGGWDPKKRRFVLVDGWEDGTSNQGLLIYETKTKTWTRFAIDIGEGDTFGFQVRDVAATSKGKLSVLVKNTIDPDPAYSHYVVPIAELDMGSQIATANWAGRVQIRNEYVSYVALAYDPRSNGKIYLQSPDYSMDVIGASSGAVLATTNVEPSYDDLTHFDIDSSRHYWAYGGNGAELLYGALDNSRANDALGPTAFSSTLNCMIIQRKKR